MCGALRKSTEMSFLNFSELVANGHVTVSHDNMMYAVDLVMLVNNKDRIQANNTLHNLKGSLFSSQKILTKKNAWERQCTMQADQLCSEPLGEAQFLPNSLLELKSC